jgi:hypothetical protein
VLNNSEDSDNGSTRCFRSVMLTIMIDWGQFFTPLLGTKSAATRKVLTISLCLCHTICSARFEWPSWHHLHSRHILDLSTKAEGEVTESISLQSDADILEIRLLLLWFSRRDNYGSLYFVNDNETAESKGSPSALCFSRRRDHDEVKQKPGRSVRAPSQFS